MAQGKTELGFKYNGLKKILIYINFKGKLRGRYLKSNIVLLIVSLIKRQVYL